jgi:hypothetical protein
VRDIATSENSPEGSLPRPAKDQLQRATFLDAALGSSPMTRGPGFREGHLRGREAGPSLRGRGVGFALGRDPFRPWPRAFQPRAGLLRRGDVLGQVVLRRLAQGLGREALRAAFGPILGLVVPLDACALS